MALNPNRNIRIRGTTGHDVETWLRMFGGPLEPCSKEYIRKVVEIGRDNNLDYINVTGFRSPRDQCAAIYANWKRHYGGGNEKAALSWAKRVYGKSRGPMLHRKYLRIFQGKWTFDAYVRDFIRRNARRASHSNGRAFDVRPVNPVVDKVLHKALGRGAYRRYGKGIVNEKDHYHVQLSPPHTVYINFDEDEALIIEASIP